MCETPDVLHEIAQVRSESGPFLLIAWLSFGTLSNLRAFLVLTGTFFELDRIFLAYNGSQIEVYIYDNATGVLPVLRIGTVSGYDPRFPLIFLNLFHDLPDTGDEDVRSYLVGISSIDNRVFIWRLGIQSTSACFAQSSSIVHR